MVYEDFVPERLAKLRMQKGVSARDMSLSLGQANNYINNVENKKTLPSMQSFFSESYRLKRIYRRGKEAGFQSDVLHPRYYERTE